MISYGVPARLAWYWRRVQRKPVTLTYLHPPLGFDRTVIDPRPPWRKPRPQWTSIGYTAGQVPEGFRRGTHLDLRQVPTELKRPSMDAGYPPDVLRPAKGQVSPQRTPAVPTSTRIPRPPRRCP